MIEWPLIYLTGAPATGKTTVTRFLSSTQGARVFSYGQALRDHATMHGITHEQLRDQSSKVVTRALISELDASLPSLLAGWRKSGVVVIDSHAVTSERWGLGAMPYSTEDLRALGVSHLVCLIADGETLRRRIVSAPAGRRNDDSWKLEQVNSAQLALAASYAHTLGIGLSAIDARVSEGEVCDAVVERCGLIRCADKA